MGSAELNRSGGNIGAEYPNPDSGLPTPHSALPASSPHGTHAHSCSLRLTPWLVRAGQREFERGVERHRIAGLLARRQYGKTTIAARIALKKMMRSAGHTVVFGSVKLDLGREIVRKEAEALQKAFSLLTQVNKENEVLLTAADTHKGKELPTTNSTSQTSPTSPTSPTYSKFSSDDWAELYEACRLEFRLYHDRTTYSRTKVVALTPSAVGETGDLILDEVGRVKKFRDVWEAVRPIIASNPEFRCLLTTTPPLDDSHYSFELLAPPIGEELPVRPEGNWYRSELGIWVLRVTAWDAYADGVPLYDDDSGAPLSPDESRARDHDKDAWDRNYGCKFVLGGTCACGLLALDTAQRRGVGECAVLVLQSDEDFDQALRWLREHLGSGAVGFGWDLATTTKGTSNPSAFAVVEQSGLELIVRAVFVWKLADPEIMMERVRRIVALVRGRTQGGRGRRLCVDATNERLFAWGVRRDLGPEVPVELVVGSETVEVPGEEGPITMKQFLGGRLVGELEENHLWLPPERYLREDWRLVKKEKGMLVCEPDVNGRHGDTFDAVKLASHALRSNSGALTGTEGIRIGGRRGAGRMFLPRRLS